MHYGHVHGMDLEGRDGGMYVTIEYVDMLQEECERRRSQSGATVPVILLRTPVVATAQIIDAFNSGNSSYLRSDDQARAVRLALFDFLMEHASQDARWAIIADDLRRHATKLLCIADRK